MAFYGDETGTVQVGALTGSTSNDLYRMCIPLMVLTTLAVTLRVYVRGYMTKTFSVEDWLIVPAYALFMVMCICAIVMGQWLLVANSMERLERIIKLTVGGSVVFVVDQIFIKLSVAFYFHRICEHWQRYVIFGTVSIFCLYQVAFMFVSIFQCGVPTVWNLVGPKTDRQCIDWIHIVRPMLYVSVLLNAACDWIFVLACLPVLTKLQRMPIGETACLYFLIFLATGASVLSLVRLGFISGDGTDVSLLTHDKTFSILSWTEAGTAIITVCMATLHPLFQSCARKRGSFRYPATSKPRRPESSEPISCAKRPAESFSLEEMSTEHSSLGRIGILPTILDTEMGTVTERDPPQRGYTMNWT